MMSGGLKQRNTDCLQIKLVELMNSAMPPRAGRAGMRVFAGNPRISAVCLTKLPVDLYILPVLTRMFTAAIYVPVTAMYRILAEMCIPITAMYRISEAMYR